MTFFSAIDVVKQVVSKYLQIMKKIAKMVAILLYFVPLVTGFSKTYGNL